MGDISFICVGDWGSGNADQVKVARAMAKYYRNYPFQFVCGLGDNFYPKGVTSSNYRTIFTRLFTAVYQNLPIPFYMILGNHDHYGDPTLQCNLSSLDSRWHLPNPYYQFEIISPQQCRCFFVAIDSESLQKKTKESEQQLEWIRSQLKKNKDKAHWTFLLAHHPVSSNGCHGEPTPYYSKSIRNLLRKYPIDAIWSGHDHDKQITRLPCGATQIIVGTGGFIRHCPRPSVPHGTAIFLTETLGFCTVDITKYILELRMLAPTSSYDLNGDGNYQLEYSYRMEPRSRLLEQETA